MPTQYNVTRLKLTVAGFLKRELGDFLRKYGAEEVDLLLQACNNARLYAERLVDFEKSHEQVYLQIDDILEGVSLSESITWATRNEIEADQVAVKVKKIITAYIATTDGAQVPVDVYSKKQWAERMKRNVGLITEARSVNVSENTPSSELCLVQDGDMLFVSPASTATFPSGSVTLALDVIKWLDPYEDGVETDFLLEFCFDWLQYRCIYELNQYLKEDERVVISKETMTDAWNSLVKWNSELVESVTMSTNL